MLDILSIIMPAVIGSTLALASHYEPCSLARNHCNSNAIFSLVLCLGAGWQKMHQKSMLERLTWALRARFQETASRCTAAFSMALNS